MIIFMNACEVEFVGHTSYKLFGIKKKILLKMFITQVIDTTV